MEHHELVSVIIPTFNRANRVGNAIQSVLDQNYPEIQLIVVDDGSTDHTARIVNGYPNTEYVRQSHRGQAAARNAGLARAQGTVIATLDSDDVWDPRFLETCVDKLSKEALDFVFTNWYQDNGNGGWSDFMVPNPLMKPFIARASDRWITLEGAPLRNLYLKACPSPSSSAVIRRFSIKTGWNEEIRIGDDWCLYLDMILDGTCRVAFTFDKLWRKGVENSGIFEGRDRGQLLQLLYIEDFDHFMIRYKDLVSPSELNILKRKHMESLVELAKFNMIHKYDFLASCKLVKRSMENDLIFTLKTIPRMFATGVRNRLSSIF